MTGADLLAMLPILLLVGGSTLLLMVGTWPISTRSLLFSGIGIALCAALAAIWQIPPVAEVAGMFGTGAYARFFTVLWSLAAVLTLGFSLRYGDDETFPGGEYVSLVLFAAAGMAILSAATSLVGLFLGLESFTLALYILIAFNKRSAEGAEAGLKYLILGAVATGFLAFGIALIYAAAGTFHLPEAMATLSTGAGLRPLGLVGLAMLVVALGFKVSLVPFHLWTPDVYQGAPAPVTGILATGSKGAVFAAMITLFRGLEVGWPVIAPLLWVLAAATMVVGTLCALRQENVKRMLAYSSVVHMGYVLIGILAGKGAGHGAVVFYLAAYAAVSLGAFGVIAALSRSGREPQVLDDYRGYGFRHPVRAGAMAVFLFSLAGVPPTAGFIAKFGIFFAAMEAGYIGLALLGILASLISVYYYLRLVIVLFMADSDAPAGPKCSASEYAAVVACLAATLILGIFPGPLLDFIKTLLS